MALVGGKWQSRGAPRFSANETYRSSVISGPLYKFFIISRQKRLNPTLPWVAAGSFGLSQAIRSDWNDLAVFCGYGVGVDASLSGSKSTL